MKNKMRKILFILSILVVNSFSLNAQYVIDWQQCYGGENNDEATGIVEVDDGFLIVGGSSSPNNGLVECDFGNHINGTWLIKIDDNANLQWGDCSRHGCMAFDRKLSGNYFYLLGGRDFPTTGKTGLGITRIDENGNAIWERIVGNEDRDFWYMISGIATNDGGALGFANPCFSGGDISHAYGGIDGWLIKLDSLGNTEWEVTLGTNEVDFVHGLCETSDEGFIALMYSRAGAMPGSLHPCKPESNWIDAMLVKVSKDGNIEWNSCYGGTEVDNFCAGIETNDGYLLIGQTESDDGDLENAGYHLGYDHSHKKTTDIWLLRLDYEGNIIWSRCYGGFASEYSRCVFQNEDGGFTVFARSESFNGDVQSASHWDMPSGTYESGNWWIFRTDSEGNLLWERAIGSRSGSREELRDVVKHNDREYTIAGSAPNWDEFNYIYHGDIECTNNFLCGMPGSYVYWIVHIRDVFDYNAAGESNAESEYFKIYPIPANGILTISGGEEEYHYVLYNSIGQQVFNGSAQNEKQINVSSLSKGIYFLKLNTMTRSKTKKVVINY